MITEKKLFLLDAYALIFRAYYAFIKNPRYNSKGLNTSAVLGFTNTLYEVISIEKPSHIAVVFDPPTPTFRSELFPAYKANRDATPEDIIKSVPYIKKIIDGFNIPIIEIAGFEADDAIGTLAKKAEKKGFITYMMTPDKDFGQLVSDKIFIYKPRLSSAEHEILGIKEICEKYGIDHPEQVIDILAIWGDAADNVPGIQGIGEKTSSALIQKYKSVEGIYEHINELKGKQKENFENGRETVQLSKKLVSISLDVPVEFDEALFKFSAPDYKILDVLFKELEFNALSKRIIPDDNPKAIQGNLFTENETIVESIPENKIFKDITNTTHRYVLIENEQDLSALVLELNKRNEFCFDTETTGTDPHRAEWIGISFSFNKHEAYYIPVSPEKSKIELIVKALKPVLEHESIKKVGQNIKYDIIVLARYGITVKGALFDTMIAHYLLDPSARHNLNNLAEIYLNYRPVPIEDLIGKRGKDQLSMRQISIDRVKEYAGEDADITFQLKEVLELELKKDAALMELADEVEFPLIYVLAEMERNGVKVSIEKLKKFEHELSGKIQETEKLIYRSAGTTFNIASPKQLGLILFEQLKITDKPKTTKTKQYATDEQELQKLKDKHEIVKLILDYRGYTKLLSTYVKALPELINPLTGKIHTSYNQAVTATGRLSSTDPNLQNIPIRTDDGKKIREAFIPEDSDHVLFSADYSQIELRLMAHLSGDKNMIGAFNNNEDIHSATASKIYNVPIASVDKEMRAKAKSANFGIIYGISSFGLAQNINVSRSEAKALIDQYFELYPDVKTYMNDSIKKGRENGYVTTLYGRKRVLSNINSRNSLLRSNDERNAINAPIQGTAADIIKIAMINCRQRLKEADIDAKMILQVHDELVFDIKKSEVEKAATIIEYEMEHAVRLSIDLIVESKSGSNWLEAH